MPQVPLPDALPELEPAHAGVARASTRAHAAFLRQPRRSNSARCSRSTICARAGLRRRARSGSAPSAGCRMTRSCTVACWPMSPIIFLLETATLRTGRFLAELHRHASIDHAMWFHRPLRVDEWLLYAVDAQCFRRARLRPGGPVRARWPPGREHGAGRPRAYQEKVLIRSDPDGPRCGVMALAAGTPAGTDVDALQQLWSVSAIPASRWSSAVTPPSLHGRRATNDACGRWWRLSFCRGSVPTCCTSKSSSMTIPTICGARCW